MNMTDHASPDLRGAAEPLYHDHFFAQFYDLQNVWSEDRAYCLDLAKGCKSVLDLGCGTGSLATAIAKHVPRVVGADPAPGMLEVAQARHGGERVKWIEGDACDIRLGERFDLICMTGHAFQCLRTRDDRAKFMRTLAAHLAPDGRFIFDSRNPVLEEWREWTPELTRLTLQHPQLGEVETWHDVSFDPATAVAAYGTTYSIRASGESSRTEARIAFPPRTEIDELLLEADLRVEQWLGDWDGSAWNAMSPELIALGGLDLTRAA
jgi:SAM-dependent methyltransferase